MKFSIKQKLIFSLACCFLITMIINATLTSLLAREEIDEMFDAELLATTKIIRATIDNPHLLDTVGHLYNNSHQTTLGLSSSQRKYEKKLLVQIWSAENNERIFSSPSSPDHAIAPLQEGYYRGDPHLVVHALPLSENRGWLLVGEVPDAREEISEELIEIFSLSGGLVLTLAILLLLPSIRFSLKPLSDLGDTLKERSLSNLQTIDLQHSARELDPVLESTNQLLIRLEISLERERSFISDASHELRTPLAALKLQAQYLQSQTKDSSVVNENINEDLKGLVSSVERADKVVSQLLLLARLDGQKNLITEPLSILDIIQQAAADTYLSVEAKQSQINLPNIGSPIYVKGNAVLLTVAIKNLIDNALNYGPYKNVIDITVIEIEGQVRISVLDQGPGVEEQFLDKLSQRFFRVQSHSSYQKSSPGHSGREVPGTGLGLSIVLRIAQMENGRLEFSNREEKGLAVVLTLQKSESGVV